MSQLDEISELFAAERRERPPPEASAKGWHELTTALQADLTAMPVAHGPLKLGLSLAAKWGVGSGLAALAVVAGGAGVSHSFAGHQPVTEPLAVLPAAPLARAERTLSSGAVPPASPPTLASAAASPLVAPSASSRTSTFAEELRLIKLAKQEQDAGRFHLAQVWLDQHEQLYPKGVFSTERDAMRVLLACQESPRGGRERAQQFIERNPGSPLLDRITRVCWPMAEPAPTTLPSPEPVGSSRFPNLETDK